MKWKNTLDEDWTRNETIWLESQSVGRGAGSGLGDRQKIRWLVGAFDNFESSHT